MNALKKQLINIFPFCKGVFLFLCGLSLLWSGAVSAQEIALPDPDEMWLAPVSPKVITPQVLENGENIQLFESCQFGVMEHYFLLLVKYNHVGGAKEIKDGWKLTLNLEFYPQGGTTNKIEKTVELDRSENFTVESLVQFTIDPVVCNTNAHIKIKSYQVEGVDDLDDFIQSLSFEVQTYYPRTNTCFSENPPSNLRYGEETALVSWEDEQCTDEYEVQWLYREETSSVTNVDDLFVRGSGYPVVHASTDKLYYSFTPKYPEGEVYLRVRAIAYDPEGIVANYSGWSMVIKIDMNEDLAEANHNWQSVSTFAEGGKKKHVVSYFDGMGKNRQVLTNLSTVGKTLVAESHYDYEGRSVLDVLPAPSTSDSLVYNKKFNEFDGSVDPIFSGLSGKALYDNGPLMKNAPLKKGRGAGLYYSEGGLLPGFVPDANGYAYSYKTLTRDATGRDIRNSGVGEAFQEGERNTNKSYGLASKTELEHLFGSEIGNSSYYRKNVTIDPNGQKSVSYTDIDGKVVATGLIGKTPKKALEDLPSAQSGDLVIDLTEGNIKGDGETTLMYQLNNLFDDDADQNDGNNYSFSYSATINNFSTKCFECSYDILIYAISPTGVRLNLEANTGITNDITTYNFDLNLKEEGVYKIFKVLTLVTPDLIALRDEIIRKKQDSINAEFLELQAEHPVDDIGCISVSDDALTQAREANRSAEISSELVCGQKEGCDSAFCVSNVEVVAWEDEVNAVKGLSEALDVFGDGTSFDLLNHDPYFQLGDQVALNKMRQKLNDFTLRIKVPAVFTEECNSEEGYLERRGALLELLDPDNEDMFVYQCGLKGKISEGTSPTPIGHVLYYAETVAEEGEKSETYSLTLDDKKWTLYRSYYLKIRNEFIAEMTGCDAVIEETNAIYGDLPETQEELLDAINELQWKDITDEGEIIDAVDDETDEKIIVNIGDITELVNPAGSRECIIEKQGTVDFITDFELTDCDGNPIETGSYVVCDSFAYKIPQVPGVDDLPSGGVGLDGNLAITSEEEATLIQELQDGCQQRVKDTRDTLINDLKERYIDELVTTEIVTSQASIIDSLTEKFDYTINRMEHHYTLYYYDVAGNLIRTIPPAGVRPGDVDANPHKMPTTYEYNSINQLSNQDTPDAGTTQFYYDKKGMLRLSQNAEQRCANEGSDSPCTFDYQRYSYTKYDAHGRVIEVGEIHLDVGGGTTEINTALVDNPDFPNVNEYQLVDRVVTYYDEAYTGETYDTSLFTQSYLRGRVSAVESYGAEDEKLATTVYSYDPHGNVLQLLQDVVGLEPKIISYDYDLISGNVNEVHYQKGDDQEDDFYHRYTYDDDNRIIKVETSEDRILWDQDASYNYYVHGPLRSVELGHDNLQKLDYHYTLQGWLKGINTPFMGGNESDPAPDEFALRLGYYKHDIYGEDPTTVLATVPDFIPNESSLADTYSNYGLPEKGAHNLYNGNISWMTTYLRNLPASSQMHGAIYSYDQLNRIKRTSNFTNFSAASGFSGTYDRDAPLGAYDASYTYDPNGNLETLKRNNEDGNLVSDLEYGYTKSGSDLVNNRLVSWDGRGTVFDTRDGGGLPSSSDIFPDVSIKDFKLSGPEVKVTRASNSIIIGPDTEIGDGVDFTAEIVDAPADGKTSGANYGYDDIGNLIANKDDGTQVEWNVQGKVRRVKSEGGFIVEYGYDGAGNRVFKKTFHEDDPSEAKMKHYIRDASGNVMAIYDDEELSEQAIYGSSRLGYVEGEGVDGQRRIGLKRYELTNHLGNVMAVLSDKRYAEGGNARADVLNVKDYYPFGKEILNRSTYANSYRYGFNGKEKDSDMGVGLHYDYGFRIYNPDIARFLSVDPLTSGYPFYTPYQFAGNKPIQAIDLDGLEEKEVVTASAPGTVIGLTTSRVLERTWTLKEMLTETGVDFAKRSFNTIGAAGVLTVLFVLTPANLGDDRASKIHEEWSRNRSMQYDFDYLDRKLLEEGLSDDELDDYVDLAERLHGMYNLRQHTRNRKDFRGTSIVYKIVNKKTGEILKYGISSVPNYVNKKIPGTEILGNPRPAGQVRELNNGSDQGDYTYEIMHVFDNRQEALDKEQQLVDEAEENGVELRLQKLPRPSSQKD